MKLKLNPVQKLQIRALWAIMVLLLKIAHKLNSGSPCICDDIELELRHNVETD